MSILRRKKRKYPAFPEGDYEPVVRSSICTGEQVLCARDRNTGKLHELTLIRSTEELQEFCEENAIDPKDVRTVY